MNFLNKCPFRKTEMTQNSGTLIQRIGYKSVGLWLKEKKVATLCGNDLQKARGSLYSELGRCGPCSCRRSPLPRLWGKPVTRTPTDTAGARKPKVPDVVLAKAAKAPSPCDSCCCPTSAILFPHSAV